MYTWTHTRVTQYIHLSPSTTKLIHTHYRARQDTGEVEFPQCTVPREVSHLLNLVVGEVCNLDQGEGSWRVASSCPLYEYVGC